MGCVELFLSLDISAVRFASGAFGLGHMMKVIKPESVGVTTDQSPYSVFTA